MHIFNNTVTKYHCTKCGSESVVRAFEKELMMKCCDGEKPVLHRQGKRPETMTVPEPKHDNPEPTTPSTQEQISKMPVSANQPSGGSKLDQPLSGVKATVKGTK
jgi:hypothetical protein